MHIIQGNLGSSVSLTNKACEPVLQINSKNTVKDKISKEANVN